jgi:RecJ-like exonuclease
MSEEVVDERTDVHGNVVLIRSFVYTCTLCAPEFMLSADSRSCETTQVIGNCLNYVRRSVEDSDGSGSSEEVVCDRCIPGFWLSKDRKSCIEDQLLLDNGCKEGVFSQEIVCAICQLGFMMNEVGECVKCGGTGCAVCDSSNFNNCLLCGPGYYMDPLQNCVKNINYFFSVRKEDISGGSFSKKIVSSDEGSGDTFGNFVDRMRHLFGLLIILIL